MGFDPQWFIYFPLEYRVDFLFEALYSYLTSKVLEGLRYADQPREPSDYTHLLNDLRKCLAASYDPSQSIFDVSNVRKCLQLSTEYMATHSIVPNLLANAMVHTDVIPYEFEVE